MKTTQQNSSGTPKAKKRVYHRPNFTTIGDVVQLTAAGTGGMSDAAMTMM